MDCHKKVNNIETILSPFSREVDEALRPGVYALIDVCSADDLQYLHTAFGRKKLKLITIGEFGC